MKVRLNFHIPEKVNDDLERYCADVGRHPTELIRQLVTEMVEGDRVLRGRLDEPSGGRRTSIMVSHIVLEALEQKANAEKKSKASIVSNLLRYFLLARTPGDRTDAFQPDSATLFKVALARLVDECENLAEFNTQSYHEALDLARSLLGREEEMSHAY